VKIRDNGKLVIENDATLELGDYAVVRATSGADSIIVYGNLIVGKDVSFISDQGTSLLIDIRNDDLILSIDQATFDHIRLTGMDSVLMISNSSFNNSSVEYQRLYDSQYGFYGSTFTNTSVNAYRSTHGEAVFAGNLEIVGCNFDNQVGEEVISLDGFRSYLISHDTLEYSMGDGIGLYHSGSQYGTYGDHAHVSNCEIYYTGDPSQTVANGITAYWSYVVLQNNYIHNNTIGLSCLDQSILRLFGNEKSNTPSETQQILDNWTNQLYSDGTSFPCDFDFNYVDNTVNNDYLRASLKTLQCL